MENVETRWVQSGKDGEYYKIGPDHRDYKMWGLTTVDMVNEYNAIHRALANVEGVEIA